MAHRHPTPFGVVVQRRDQALRRDLVNPTLDHGGPMPFYRILSQRDTIGSAEKVRLAEEIVQLHLRLAGGTRALVNVLFEEFSPGDLFVGGKPVPRLIASASIRAARTQDVKTALLQGYSALISRVAGVPESDLLVSVGEVRPENMMEAGHI